MHSLLQRLVSVSLVVVFVVAFKSPWIIAQVIRYDLRDYAKNIRASSISIDEKERLLDLTDGLGDRLSGGGRIGLIEWLDANDAIRPMLDDGVNSGEVRLIERELQRLTKE